MSIELDLSLHPAQLEVFEDPARFVAVAAGRRFGKSDLAAKRAIIKAMDPRNTGKKPVWIVGPVQPQVKQIYWNILMALAKPLIKTFNVNEGNMVLSNDVQLGIRGSDRPDNMRGVGLWDVTIDEYADMKADVWEAILRPALADVKGSGMFIGTPKGRNHFWKLWQAAATDTTGEWAAYHFTTLDNPFIDPAEVEAARKSMSSSKFRQEFMASFETGGSDVMKKEWVKYGPEPKEGEWFVAVDLAGFSAVAAMQGPNHRQKRLDHTAISVVKVTPAGKWWVKKIVYGRWGVEETAQRIIKEVEECRPTKFGIEDGALYRAVEPYLVSLAAKKRIPLRVERLSHENQAKADRIVWALQGRLEHGDVTFAEGDWNDEFEDQLEHFPSNYVHDDLLDSLAYIAQLAKDMMFESYGHVFDEPYWEPLNAQIGY